MKVTSETQETGPHFLLIVGPSGSGKSTFIRMLKTGSLEKSIFELLPNNCQDWPTVEGNEIFKGKTTTKKLKISRPIRTCSDRQIPHYQYTYADPELKGALYF
jgi:energy-coupling factor transporter ATP-binding protein EcfA2